jgi:hypothetical protein
MGCQNQQEGSVEKDEDRMMFVLDKSICQVSGLTINEQQQLSDLIDVYNAHVYKNAEKNKFYEGNVTLSEVNLGIALPDGLRNLEIGCEWGAKTVDVLASRSIFDGFVGSDGRRAETMERILSDNRLISEYTKSCKDELKYGCTFATLSADENIGCRIRFHSPVTAAALWDGESGRIDCGLSILDAVKDETMKFDFVPAVIRFDTVNSVIIFRKEGNGWTVERRPHKMGRPLMEPMIWNATPSKPFGRSRLKKPIRELIKGYVRTIANATIGLEFATSPQKYLLGVTDEQYDAIISNKFKQYVGSILAATTNPETGNDPKFGQLQQGSIGPHVEMVRLLATQFSAATGLSVTDTGVVNDANPTSSDAILAQSQTLVLMAEQLNESNGDSLKMIAMMAQAIVRNVSLNDLTEEEMSVMAHFKNPAMPSVAMTADAATKIASAREGFANTDIFLEMIGFDQADIRRIKSQEQYARGLNVLSEIGNAE